MNNDTHKIKNQLLHSKKKRYSSRMISKNKKHFFDERVIYVLLVLHTLHLIGIATKNTITSTLANYIVGIPLSYVSILLPYFIGKFLFHKFPKTSKAFTYVYLLFYGILSSYLFTARSSFDFSIMANNAHSAFSREATLIMVKGLHVDSLILAILACIYIFFREKKTKQYFQDHKKITHPWKKAALSTGLYSLLVVAPFYAPFDEPLSFFKSIHQYYSSPSTITLEQNTYPFLSENIKSNELKSIQNPTKSPTIFLILVEAFNGTFIHQTAPEGFEYTPYFNQLTKEGLFIEHFYGNSIQTAKGHFATFFSTIPSIRGIEYTKYPNLSLKSFPEYLVEAGYDTSFFKSHKNEHFDNTQAMMLKHGFNHFEAFKNIPKEDQKNATYWGAEDGVFYKHVFSQLDKRPTKKPQFIALATIYSHGPFECPPHRRMHYKNPSSIQEEYINVLGRVDEQLSIFFDELKKRPDYKDAIVIITGDHSWPMKTGARARNEVGFFESSFKTPFLMLWPGHIQPQVIKEPASQLDIAPTILELAGISNVKNHFQGQSLFLPREMNRPIPLIQPYDGICISVVSYPHKIARRIKTGETFLFNLEKDPDESINLYSTLSKKQKDEYEKLFHPIFLTQTAIEQNQIWKP